MISITGGSGFIGSNLGSRLAERQIGFNILDIRQSPLHPEHRIDCDICNLERLHEALGGGGTVIHLAAEHRDDVRPISRYHDVNVIGTQNITKAAREKGIERIIFTSTVAVYGFAKSNTGEDGEIAPFNEYGRTKYAAEQILRSWQQEVPERRSLTIIRPTVVFGPGNRGNVFNLLSFIHSGKFFMIGNGANRKSMAFVGNIANFLHTATRFGPGIHIYNYVDKPDLSMNELVSIVRDRLLGKPGVGLRFPFWLAMVAGRSADVIAHLTNRNLPISAIRVRKFCATTSFASAAHSVEGFTADTSLRDAIELTLEEEFVSPRPNRAIFYTE